MTDLMWKALTRIALLAISLLSIALSLLLAVLGWTCFTRFGEIP
jgi:hypothetical protein